MLNFFNKLSHFSAVKHSDTEIHYLFFTHAPIITILVFLHALSHLVELVHCSVNCREVVHL